MQNGCNLTANSAYSSSVPEYDQSNPKPKDSEHPRKYKVRLLSGNIQNGVTDKVFMWYCFDGQRYINAILRVLLDSRH